jgi:hypothetical protein
MTLTKFFLLLTVSISLYTETSAQATKSVLLKQNSVKTDARNEDQNILAVRNACQTINSKNLKKQHFRYESDGCVEDGVVDYFIDNKEIVKIIESGAIGDGSWVNEYYYDSGKVIFCFEKLVGGPAIGKVTTSEYRVYIQDGRPIKIMEGKKTVAADSKTMESIQTANKIYKAHVTKDFVSALCN